MTDLTGRVAVVTGSARGIGKAVAQRFASLGAAVVVNYAADEDAAARTVGEIEEAGGRALAVRADVSSTQDLDALFARALEEFGRVDVVVSNAGVEVVGSPVLEATEEEFDRSYAVNAKGAFFTLQKGAKVLSDGGRLIHIGSSTVAGSHAGAGLYSSSKAGAVQLVRVLAVELGPRGITANTILPTAVAGAGVFTGAQDGDEFHRANAVRPLGGRPGRPEDVADAAEYFAGELSGWVSGQTLLVAGGLDR
ncbi:SDR family oxidoreductase [Kineococcus terrestris]|uniref:SDR family oxidoreductase n=1 Tax=Kineococcus terrestris TaxID=2044856 RepID=UPI0034DB1FD8